MNNERVDRQFDFIREIDKEKMIRRQTYKTDGTSRENDAEHAWHMAIMAYLLKEYSNEDIDISLSAIVELRNPLVRNILNGSRVYFHAYVNYLVDLWEGAKNFLDAGRSGQISLQRPNLIYKFHSYTLRYEVNACTPMSLLNFLGLPAEALPTKNNSQAVSPLLSFESALYSADAPSQYSFDDLAASPDFFPADCAFAYQRNWRDYYSNQNLLQDNKRWFPDNEDHFILSYNCENAVAVNYENEYFTE